MHKPTVTLARPQIVLAKLGLAKLVLNREQLASGAHQFIQIARVINTAHSYNGTPLTAPVKVGLANLVKSRAD